MPLTTNEVQPPAAGSQSGSRGDAVQISFPPLAELQGRRSDKWAGYPPSVISATIAEMDVALAEPVAAALQAAVARHDLGYTPHSTHRLAEAFAGFAARRLHWTVEPDQVSVVTDVMVGLLELARALTGPDQSVAFSTPAYPPFLQELPRLGLVVHPIPLLEDGTTDLPALAAAFASGIRVFILTNPHNPTGRVLPRPELVQIADLAADHQAWILADEIHAPLTLPGAVHQPFLEVSTAARERGFALTSASKAFNLAAVKTALVVTAADGPRAVMSRLVDLTDHASLLGVLAAEAAFADGDAWLDALLRHLDRNRALLGSLLAEHLPAVGWKPPDASYLAWLDCRGLQLGDDPAPILLDQTRVALSPGPTYGEPGAGHARLNFGTSSEILTRMIERLANLDATGGETFRRSR